MDDVLDTDEAAREEAEETHQEEQYVLQEPVINTYTFGVYLYRIYYEEQISRGKSEAHLMWHLPVSGQKVMESNIAGASRAKVDELAAPTREMNRSSRGMAAARETA